MKNFFRATAMNCLLMVCIKGSSFAQNAKVAKTDTAKLKYGKYGCTSSRYSGGSVEYTPRGSFTILTNGKYTYSGLEKPSNGTFVVDKAGNLLFKGGYFDSGKAEKIDRPDKFFLVFPANSDHRWTCGWAGK